MTNIYSLIIISEGSEGVRGVNCSFDTPYLCGYTLSDGIGRKWFRKGISFAKDQPGLNKLLKKSRRKCFYLCRFQTVSAVTALNKF